MYGKCSLKKKGVGFEERLYHEYEGPPLEHEGPVS